MKLLFALLLCLFLVLQYKLWVAKQGSPQIARLEGQKKQLIQQNLLLEQQNQHLQNQVNRYKQGLDGFEERAREDLGMVKKGEVFYQVVPAPTSPPVQRVPHEAK
ncbi:MAG: septum formation initiator family protein [Gammaproteobacteria bacterium]|nr:septum formation initiator family protein [Gammaproteobacteria bacterium]